MREGGRPTGRRQWNVYARLMCSLLLAGSVATSQSVSAAVTTESGRIDIVINSAYQPESLTVVLDNSDVTALTRKTDQGISFTPMYPLEAGEHQLRISFVSLEGYQMRQTVVIDTQADRVEYRGASLLGVTLRGLAYDRNDVQTQHHEADVHVNHSANWRANSWEGETRADVWWFDRGDIADPLYDNGPEVIDYYASAVQQDGDRHFVAEAGYLQLHQSQYTVNRLARRGARANYDNRRFEFDVFSVDSRQQIGAEGGLGVGTGSDASIVGLAAAWKKNMATQRDLEVRTIYSKGSDAAQSFGSLNAGAETEGDVAGILVQSSFRDLGFYLEMEYDRSSYDPDINDNIDADSDHAYGMRAHWQNGSANYRVALENVGPHYAVVANPLLRNDRRYLTLSADYSFDRHGFGISGQVENDNLDDDPTRPRLNKTYVAGDYRYHKGQDINASLSVRNSTLQSEDEPAVVDVRDVSTNSVLARLSMLNGQWVTQLSAQFSRLDDQTPYDDDNDIVSYSISPALLAQNLYFMPSYTFTETEYTNSRQIYEQQILNLYLQGKAFSERLTYQLSGSLSKYSDATGDADSNILDMQMDWSMGYFNFLAVRSRHAVGMELRYVNSEANNSVLQDDAVIWLTYKIEAALQH